MSISDETIVSIAHLARISIEETDIPRICERVNKVMDLVDQINEVDTDGVTPMSHAIPNQVQRLREDTVTETNAREAMQALCPHTEAGLYLVPKVIEE